MPQLNYHHLNYFRVVAKTGNLTHAAQQLHIAQSALSTQIKQLEQQLGQALFIRQRRGLELTEAGRIALSYADSIHNSGSELLGLFRDDNMQARQMLRIGAVATLSRNFQESFIEPLLLRTDVTLVLQSGGLTELLSRLSVHNLDLVLSNRRVHADATHAWRCQRITRQPVSLVGKPRHNLPAFNFPADLKGLTVILPSTESELRAGFDLLCEQLDIRVKILAEVDDMAMLRVLARVADAPVLVPTVVVRDELKQGLLQEYVRIPDLYEDFFAIGIQRQYQHPLLKMLLERESLDNLG